jgi:hypothetical protein
MMIFIMHTHIFPKEAETCDVLERTWKLYFHVVKSSKTTSQTRSWRELAPNDDIRVVFELASSFLNLSIDEL